MYINFKSLYAFSIERKSQNDKFVLMEECHVTWVKDPLTDLEHSERSN